MNSNLFDIINHVNRVVNLIKHQATGTRAELAGKLGISERSLDNLIAQLRQLGAPIAFCRYRRTYYFEHDVDIRFGVYPEDTCDEDEPCTQELQNKVDAKASGCSSDKEIDGIDKTLIRKRGGVKSCNTECCDSIAIVCNCMAI